jgi:hypothetical protein
MSAQERYSTEEAHEMFAKTFNGRVWELLEQPERNPTEDEELMLAHSASFYHWRHVGTAVHEQRGRWLFSRIFTVLDRPEDALEQAEMCMALTKANPEAMADFDVAYAHEALARSHAQLGHHKIAGEHFARAREHGEAIADAEDQEIFMGDLEAGDWYGIAP